VDQASSIQRAAAIHGGDPEGFKGWIQRTFGFECQRGRRDLRAHRGQGERAATWSRSTPWCYDEAREAEVGGPTMRRVEQYLLLNAIDSKWKDHLHAMDSLKTGIGLRSYGQLDPKNEYKREGFQLFENLMGAVEDEVASLVLRIRVEKPQTTA
jgi:preprotein translocase subunit SecA